MKIKIILASTILLFTFSGAFAQKMLRSNISERVNVTMNKISTPLKLDVSQIGRTDSAFADFYKAQNKIYAEKTSLENTRAAFKKILAERDAKLKLIFTDFQYTKFKTEVEEQLQPQFQSHEDR